MAPNPAPRSSAVRTAWVAAGLMLAASGAGILARPSAAPPGGESAPSLESLIPVEFGDWRDAPAGRLRVINPQQQGLLDKLYSQMLTRTYVNSQGYGIMLSLAYGGDQRERGSLQAHKPEVCYPAQGFLIERNEAAILATAWGDIPVRRLYATMGPRREPVTYWFTVGDTVVHGRWQKRLVDLRYGLTGRIPDGLLFRISSLDADPARAHAVQAQFIDELLHAVSADARRRLSGLGAQPPG